MSGQPIQEKSGQYRSGGMHMTGWKSWGIRFNAYYEKYMFIITPILLVLGFWLHGPLQRLLGAIPYLFAYLTLVMALGCSTEQLKEAVRRPVWMALLLIISHVAMPAVAYIGGGALFGFHSPYVLGLVLFAIIPFGVSSIIWIGLSGGQIAFTLALIVIDSAISPFFVPFAVSALFGQSIQFETRKVMLDLFVIIVIPTVLGLAANQRSKGKAKAWSAPVALPTSKLAFALVLMMNAASVAPHLSMIGRDLPILLPSVVALVLLCYAAGWLISRPMRSKEATVTATYLSGMRNISLGAVIALAYFEPKAAVPVILSILIQQPIATIVQVCFRKFTKP